MRLVLRFPKFQPFLYLNNWLRYWEICLKYDQGYNFYDNKEEAKIYQVLKTCNVFLYYTLTTINFTITKDKFLSPGFNV